MLDPTLGARLAFARHLLMLAEDQLSGQPEPLNSAALLHLHDAIELFLQLAVDHLKVIIPKNATMPDYVPPIAAAIAPTEFPYSEGLRRLNRARASLKHHGTHPSRLDLLDFAAIAASFLEQATLPIFGVPLSSISLAAAVRWQGVRDALTAAEAAQRAPDLAMARIQLSLALEHLIQEAKNRERDRLRLPYLRILDRPNDSFPRGYYDFLKDVRETLEVLEREIAQLRLGFDSHELGRFKATMPQVGLAGSGAYSYWDKHLPAPTGADYTFAYSFVLRNALRLQSTLPDTESHEAVAPS